MTISDKTRLSPPRPNWLRPDCYPLALLVMPWAFCVTQAATASAPDAHKSAAANASISSQKMKNTIMHVTIGTRRFAVTLADSAAARAFAAQLPMTLIMADLNGNEKHARLPDALPVNQTRPGRIRNGDLMLYGSTTLVLFYLTFDSSYEYTRLGRVNDPEGLAEALGTRDVRVTLAIEKM